MASPDTPLPPDRPVVTRFAPSPTGNLHIGGARTALYAWVVAQQAKRRVGPFKDHTGGGRFILRFEDTDRARSSSASEKQIAESMLWLGLDWDEGPAIPGVPGHETATGDRGPYRQSERLPLYHEQLDRLRAAGHVYDDDGAVRFRVTQDVTFVDAVYGTVTVKADDIEDFVIMKRKAEGDDLAYPTFHFAVVVDDALMEVTHVIRGVEHLSNTPKHAALYDALGFERPLWCHTPSITNPDGSKMSKRDKAKAARKAAKEKGWPAPPITNVEGFHERWQAFQDKESDDAGIASIVLGSLGCDVPEIDTSDFKSTGYLPDVLLNYLSLLGWNPGGDLERFDLDHLIDVFELSSVNKANSKFDRDKLIEFNRLAIAEMSPDQFNEAFWSFCDPRYGNDGLEWSDSKKRIFSSAYQERARVFSDPVKASGFLDPPDYEAPPSEKHYDTKAVKKWLLKNDAQGLADLAKARETLAGLDDDFAPEAIEAALGQCVADHGMKNLGSVAQPLRVAVSGAAVTPPIHLTLHLIGKAETLRRIDACLRVFKGEAEASS
ncbi:MAG: glutamate--tRNA ligase family protein [Planctomycetota bacterium]